MTSELSSLKSQLEAVAAKVEELSLKVDALSERLALAPRRTLMEATPGADDFPDPSEAVLSWVGSSSLLQRLSTVCFLLVVALILRTLTDNGLVNLQLGYLIGMGYAAVLIFMGWQRYRRANPLAPVFTVCGAILMFTIVVETHARFDALPAVPAYLLLMLTGLATAAISYIHRVPAPVAAGNLGMCVAGAAIDYPNPFFPYLAIVLLTANLLGYAAARVRSYAWLRWILLLVTLFMISLWGVKLGMSLLGGEKPAGALAPEWFLPILTLFVLTFASTAGLGMVRSLPGRIGRYEQALPTITVVWSFLLAQYVVFAMGGSAILLGAVGTAAGAGHLGAAQWLAGRDPAGARGANAFVFAGAVLLTLALPLVTGSTLLALPILSAIALLASIVSVTWHSGSLRFTSYLLQVYAAAALAVIEFGGEKAPVFWISVASAGGVTVFGILQYIWCRRRKPPEGSAFFSRVDRGDLVAVTVLLAALLSAFILLRVVVYRILGMVLTPADLNNALQCSQSVIVNLSAILLMLIALLQRSRELRNVAILVTVIGAVRVFLYDLLLAHGVPLVISVLSFGLATAVESVILGRWQRLTAPAQAGARDGASG